MSLFNIPESIRGCRVGSTMNSLSRSLKPYTVTFDPQKLSGSNLLRFVSGTGELVCQANSSSSEFAKSAIFSVDTSVAGGYAGCTASLGFNMELTSKSVSKRQGINCLVSYFYKNQKLVLLYEGSSPETLYNCMTNDFQKLYNDVMNAETNDEYLEKYNNFTQVYGHGCVTTLHLTAGSVFMINIGYSNDAEANSLRFAGSVSVNTPFGGGSVAGAWGKEVEASFSNATMSVTGENIPENTPTASWCSTMVNNFSGHAISILFKEDSMIAVPNANSPKAPALPERKDPDNKKIPAPKNTNHDLTEELKKEIMKEDNFENWGDYIEAQKKEYEKLSPNQIVSDSLKHISSDNVRPNNEINIVQNIGTETSLSYNEINDAWDLGGFVPYAYAITPWSVLFPDLKLKLPQSFTSIYYAKIYMYYLTRLQFSQYLYLLQDIGHRIIKPSAGNNAVYDADIYYNHCNDLLKKISHLDKADEKIYADIAIKFNESLLSNDRFKDIIIYNKFYELYNFMNDCQYGAVMIHIHDDGYYTYVSQDDGKKIPSSFSIASLLKDAVRAYPIISYNNEGWLFGFGWIPFPSFGWRVVFVPNEIREKFLNVITDEEGRKYIGDDNFFYGWRFYLVSSKDVPASESIRGLPMFTTLPFDDIKEFANPTPAI